MSRDPDAAKKSIGDIAPKLAELSDGVLFGDIWERPQLSKRDRSLATVAALVALYRPEQLRFHLQNALNNGRSHHPSRVLRGLAQRDDRRDRRQRGIL
jgi:4-carboxymuconolactone decarboxylase